MPKYHICVLAYSRKTYPKGLAHAVEVSSGDLYSDEREQSDHRRLELSKTLWHRMLRSASPYMSRHRHGYGHATDDYAVVKIGEGAGTDEQTAHIINSNMVDQPDLFNLSKSHLEDIEEFIFDDLADRHGEPEYLSGHRAKPEVVAIIYEVESTAPNYKAFAKQICSGKVKDDQLKKVLMFLPKKHTVLNRFEAQDLIEQKPTNPKSSKKERSSSKKKTKVASPYDDKYYQGAINELLESIQSACDEYNDKKRTKHKKEFQRLVDRLNDIKKNEPYEVEGKEGEVVAKARYKKMIGEVQFALRDAQSDFSKPFLKMGKRKTWDEYVTKVTHSSSYQYPKLLSKILHDVYSKKDPVAEAGLDLMRTKLKEIYSAIDKINAYLAKKSTPKPK